MPQNKKIQPKTLEELLVEIQQEVDEILDGIDEDETIYKNGWWETSTGADFGKKKKGARNNPCPVVKGDSPTLENSKEVNIPYLHRQGFVLYNLSQKVGLHISYPAVR